MGRYVEWYLAELERLLADSLGRERLHQLIAETESHLSERSRELADRGMSAREAELAAIEALGPPDRLAMAELGGRSARTFGLPSAWAFAAIASVAMLVLAWASIDPMGWSNGQPATWALLAATVLAAGWTGARAGRSRWAALGFAFVGCAALFVLWSGLFLRGFNDRLWNKFELAEARRQTIRFADSLDGVARRLQSGVDAFQSARSAADVPREWIVGTAESIRTLGQDRTGGEHAFPAKLAFWTPGEVRIVLLSRKDYGVALVGDVFTPMFAPLIRRGTPPDASYRAITEWASESDFQRARSRWLGKGASLAANTLALARLRREEAATVEKALGRTFVLDAG
ncbi:MAG: hypothetical protein WHU10_06085, partial [Fimbriimonadales bacterium]